MSLLEEKMYGFITQPDNWQLAREISEKMDYVKDRLLQEFWREVKERINGRLDSKEWVVDMTDLYDTYSYIRVSHNSWENLFFVAFEGLHRDILIGIQRDLVSNKVPNELHEQIANHLTSIEKNINQKSDWWPGYFFTGDDFRYFPTVGKILPSNRQALVDKYSNMLLDLKDKAKPIIDEAMKQITAGA